MMKANIEVCSVENILSATKQFYSKICKLCKKIPLIGQSYCPYCLKHLCNISVISSEDYNTECPHCKQSLNYGIGNFLIQANLKFVYIKCPLCKKIETTLRIKRHIRNCPFSKRNLKRLMLLKFYNKKKDPLHNKSPFELKLDFPRSFNVEKMHFLYQKPCKFIQIKLAIPTSIKLKGISKLAFKWIHFSELILSISFFTSNNENCQEFLNLVGRLNNNVTIILDSTSTTSVPFPLSHLSSLLYILMNKPLFSTFLKSYPLSMEILDIFQYKMKKQLMNNIIVDLKIDLSMPDLINKCQGKVIIPQTYLLVNYTNREVKLPENYISKIFDISHNLQGLSLYNKLPNKELELLINFLLKVASFNFLEIAYEEITIADFGLLLNFFTEKNAFTGIDLIVSNGTKNCKCFKKMNKQRKNLLRIKYLSDLLSNVKKSIPMLTSAIKKKENLEKIIISDFYGIHSKLIPTLSGLECKASLSSIIIYSNDPSNKDLNAKIYEVIKKNGNLKSLCLSTNLIDKSILNLFIEAIAANKKLNTLCIDLFYLSKSELDKIFDSFKSRDQLIRNLSLINTQYYSPIEKLYFSKIQEIPFYFDKIKKACNKKYVKKDSIFWKSIRTKLKNVLKLKKKKGSQSKPYNVNGILMLKNKKLEKNNIQQVFQSYIEFNSDIKLNLSENNISDSICYEIGRGIMMTTNLKTIYLSNNSIGDKGCIIITNSIQFRKEKFLLLNLDNNKITYKGLTRIMKCLKQKKLNKFEGFLTNLFFSSEGYPLLVTAINHNFLNSELEICKKQMKIEEIASLANSILLGHSKLTNLTLEECNINDKGVALICKGFLGFNSLIRKLNLNHNLISDVGTIYLMKLILNSTNLKEIRLNNNLIKDEGCFQVANGLLKNASLEFISLQENQISKEGYKVVIETLKAKPNLKFEGFLSTSFIKDDFIKFLPELEKYKIISNFLNFSQKGISNEFLKELAPFLNKNTYFTHLSFANNLISLVEMKNLAISTGNMKLITLELDHNQLNDECIKIIIKMPNFQFLIDLNLSFNAIKNDGFYFLSDAMLKHSKMKKVNLSNNEITSSILNKVLANILKIKALKCLNLKGNGIILSSDHKIRVKTISNTSHFELFV